MNGEVGQSAFVSRPRHLFPLIRQLSSRLTAVLVRLPVTPNQITLVSIGFGLASIVCFARGSALPGAVLFAVSYVLDNCDGEVARFKRLQSRLGKMLDEVGDWFIHTALFVALGVALTDSFDSRLWFWLGCSAALGVTIENLLGWFLSGQVPVEPVTPDPFGNVSPVDLPGETTWMDQAVYALRALFDADFCFILLLFALTNTLWILVAGAAIGNHVFWASSLYENGRLYHG